MMSGTMSYAPAITLLTDFGTADGYVAEVKGVLAAQAPGVPLLDMTHDVPSHDVEHARLTLARYWRRFPRGTVHLVVVDPGVGTSRAAIAVECDGQHLVGPDNGVLSPALFALDATVIQLDISASAAPTFHARDVFAPAAAALACGAPLHTLGEPWPEPVRLRTPAPVRLASGAVQGMVLTIDRFGNVITNIVARHAGTVSVAGQRLRIVRTYGDALPGEMVALIGSSGLLEIAIRNADAATTWGITRGQAVLLMPAD